jgi:hypothetical protein
MILDLRTMPETPRCKKVLYKEICNGELFIYHDPAKAQLFVKTRESRAADLLSNMQNRGYSFS